MLDQIARAVAVSEAMASYHRNNKEIPICKNFDASLVEMWKGLSNPHAVQTLSERLLVSVVGQWVSERLKGAKETNSENHETIYRV
jgi:hypothetical protein